MEIKGKEKDFHFVISGTPEITVIDHLKFFQTFGNICPFQNLFMKIMTTFFITA